MKPITAYSPVAILFTALWRILFGAVFVLIAYSLLFAMNRTAQREGHLGIGAIILMIVVSMFFAFIAITALTSGIGRTISAFLPNCYLAAGPEGISLRMPRRGWFGSFRIVHYEIQWSDVRQIVDYTFRVNGIASTKALRIDLASGNQVTIESFYFADPISTLQSRLLSLYSQCAR